MDGQLYFSIRGDEVSFNHFDAEIIVIHLTRGTYFSLRDSAAAIWNRLEAGPASTQQLTNLFTSVDDEAKALISGFLSQLSAYGLVAEGAGPVQATSSNPIPRSFVSPVLEVFDDLEGLLVADPIHEVADAGWPISADVNQYAA